MMGPGRGEMADEHGSIPPHVQTELIFSDNEVDKRVSALAFWTSPSPYT